MATCNTLFQPWIWLLFLSIILFIVFIIVIETYNIPSNTTNTTTLDSTLIPNWIWLIFLFMLVLLFISFIWYYYSSNLCYTPPIPQPIPQPIIQNPCDNIYPCDNYPCDVITPCDIQYNTGNYQIFNFDNTEDEIPLSCLNPFK